MAECAENCSFPSNRLAVVAGAGLAVTGLAHFVVPDAFRAITEPAFGDGTDQALQVNGAIETVVGTAIALPRTRRAGVVGLGLYGAYLAANMVRTQLGS